MRLSVAGAAACLAALVLAGPAGSAGAGPAGSAAGPARCPNARAGPGQLTVRQARRAVTCLVNRRRARHGLGKVRRNARLQRAAQRHSTAMDRRNFFAHDSPRGDTPVSRIRRAGYMAGASSWAIGEDLRWGTRGLGTPRRAVRAWMRSPSHRVVLLSSRYRDVGIGVSLGAPLAGVDVPAAIYTADFGARGWRD